MSNAAPNPAGKVWLVGAGPGDPDLLTLRAARLIMQAKLIVHDGLVDPAILALARPTARLISVAKQRSRHTMPQDEINALLVREALAGTDVVRLKGGDPFIFGRGGEEAEACHAAGVTVEIVPGTADRIVPHTVHAEPMAALLPHARLTLLDGVGHMPHHAAPGETIAAIRRAVQAAR